MASAFNSTVGVMVAFTGDTKRFIQVRNIKQSHAHFNYFYHYTDYLFLILVLLAESFFPLFYFFMMTSHHFLLSHCTLFRTLVDSAQAKLDVPLPALCFCLLATLACNSENNAQFIYCSRILLHGRHHPDSNRVIQSYRLATRLSLQNLYHNDYPHSKAQDFQLDNHNQKQYILGEKVKTMHTSSIFTGTRQT